MSEPTNTPAKRLLELLRSLDEVKPDPNTVFLRYSQTFNTQDIEEVWELLRKSKQLVSQYESAITPLEDADLFSTPLRPLKRLFSPQFINDSYGALRNGITPDLLRTLEFADRTLSRIKGQEPEVSSDIIREITEAVAELEELVLNSDLPIELKQALNEYVVLFRKALTEFRIIGAEAFADAFESGIAKSIRHGEALTKPEAEKSNHILTRLRNASFKAASKTVGFVIKNPETVEKVIKGIAGLID